MLRAAIVDDEYKICQLIYHLGDWEGLGIEVIAMCYDGEEALNCITHDRPDIVLTDIRMPVYDGLEIIRKTRELDIDTSFIVISGYRQFEYAQQALKYGVADFLVKTIDEKMLNAALRKAIDDLTEKRHMQDSSKKIFELKEEKGARIREQFWSNLLDNGELNINRGNDGLVYPDFTNYVYQMILIRTDRTELNARGSKFSERIIEICHEQLKTKTELTALSRSDGVYLAIGFGRKNKTAIKNRLYSIHRLTEQLTDIFGPFRIVFGLSKVAEAANDLQTAPSSALFAWQARICQSQKEIIEYDEKQYTDKYPDKSYIDRLLAEIKTASENYNKDSVVRQIQALEYRISSIFMPSPRLIMELIDNVLFNLYSALYGDNIRLIDKQRTDSLASLELSNNIHELFMRLREHAAKTIQTHYDEKMAVESSPIREAKLYIKQHYMEDISLDELASQVGLSPVYFSRLFKNIEGINYIDYLTELRINLAKELLKNTKKNIKSIAVDTGYSDEKYFRKVFKKSTGIKPSEYRKLH